MAVARFFDIEINQGIRINKRLKNVDWIRKPADSMKQGAAEINLKLIKTLKYDPLLDAPEGGLNDNIT